MEFDSTKPVCTRDGRKAEIITDHDTVYCGHFQYPIRAKVEHPSHPGIYLFLSFMANGQLKSGSNRSCHDLVNRQIWHDWMDALRSQVKRQAKRYS